jgi:spore coat protein U-like protein
MNFPRWRYVSMLLSACLTFWTPAMTAHAQTCTVSSTGVNFGNYDYINGNGTTGTVTLSCTLALLTNVSLALSAGSAPGATTSNRMMSQTGPTGSDHLSYGLFQNATSGPSCAGGIVWGNTPATEPAPIGTLLIFNGRPQSWTINGCVPNSQDVTVSTYGDTVMATVSWN